MALTITADVEPTSLAVLLTIAGATDPTRLHVDAFPQGGAAYRVRTMLTPVAGGVAAMDGDASFGVPISYVVTDEVNAATAATAAPITVTSTEPMLADALNPSSAVRVVVKSQPPNTWEARSVWWDILGSRAPFVSVAPMRYRNGDLVLYVASADERDAVIRVLASGSPFVLRTPCGDAVDDVIGLPATITEDLVLEADATGPRLLTITYQAVARELGPYAGQAGRTYAAALSESTDYGMVAGRFADYAHLLSGVPR